MLYELPDNEVDSLLRQPRHVAAALVTDSCYVGHLAYRVSCIPRAPWS